MEICGMQKEMIVAGGYNIYPKEINEVLFNHPKILEACAAGVPDEIAKWGDDFSKRWIYRYTHAAIINDLHYLLRRFFIDIQAWLPYTLVLRKQVLIKIFILRCARPGHGGYYGQQ